MGYSPDKRGRKNVDEDAFQGRPIVHWGGWRRHNRPEHFGIMMHLSIDREIRPARKAHPAFVVDDFGLILDRAAAGAFAKTREKSPDGSRCVFACGPFDRHIEVIKKETLS